MKSGLLFSGVGDCEPGGEGILPSQEIRQFATTGVICSPREVTPDQIQPASIDLRLWHEAYRVRASFLPGKSTTLRHKATANGLLDREIDITDPVLLEPGVVYLIRVMESLALPHDVHGIANAKSSTGRLDIHTRLITECGDEFERVPKGYHGDLYVEVVSRTFPILVQRGMKLNQLRFVRGQSDPAADSALRNLAEYDLLVRGDDNRPDQVHIDRGLRVTVDLQGNGADIVAYQAKNNAPPIDLSRINHYDKAEFWTPILKPSKGYLILEGDRFYILASKQRVRVGPRHAAEMVPYDPTTGEFRAHYAGFFDPGFGYGAGGEIQGTKAVLEVRPHGIPVLLEDDQFVGRLLYYKMAETPDKIYGVSIGSSYQQQGLALSKQFKVEPQSAPGSTSTSAAAAKDDTEATPHQTVAKLRTTETDDDDSILKIAFPDNRGEHGINAKNH